MIINKDRDQTEEKCKNIHNVFNIFLVSAGSEHEKLSEKKRKIKLNTVFQCITKSIKWNKLFHQVINTEIQGLNNN